MIVRIVNPSEKFKNNFDKAANKAAKEVHKLMKEKQMKQKSLKLIDDNLDELKKVFEYFWSDDYWSTDCKKVAEHFFLKGCDTALACGDSVKKLKRTISEYHFSPQGMILAKSNDGKLFMIKGFNEHGQPQWLPYPDLPQD